MKTPVSITSIASVSPLGKNPEEIWRKYKTSDHCITTGNFSGNKAFAAFLAGDLEKEIDSLRLSSSRFKHLDKSVLYAVVSSRAAMKRAGWKKGDNIGINIGSSRGATQLFEQYHENFLRSGKAETLTSPSTTLGNISSWVAQDLESCGPEISHSVTCSTGLHSVLNAIAWLQSGLTEKFLAGGSEAALTPFTVAQMQAMKIYATEDSDYPCQALNMSKTRNSMILGEGAAMLCLESGNQENAIAHINGIGYATERLKHSVSISATGKGFQKSMKMALGDMKENQIDAVVMHAPGTIKGDQSEVNAIKAVFGDDLPALTSNKWKIGHTFGASGVLSLELAVMILQHQEFIPVPFSDINKKHPEKIKNILVNAVGFGGNAVSVLVSRK